MDKDMKLEMMSEVRQLEIDILKILEQLGIEKEKWTNFEASDD